MVVGSLLPGVHPEVLATVGTKALRLHNAGCCLAQEKGPRQPECFFGLAPALAGEQGSNQDPGLSTPAALPPSRGIRGRTTEGAGAVTSLP